MLPATTLKLGECTLQLSGVRAKDLVSLQTRAAANELDKELMVEESKRKEKGKASKTVAFLKKTAKRVVKGGSNPMLRFTAPFLGEAKQSAVVKDSLNPTFADKCFPPWHCRFNSPGRLAQHAMFVQVLTRNVTDTPLGFAVVPLQAMGLEAAVKSKRGKGSIKLPFDVPISYCGKPAGSLSGSISFSWSFTNL
jgi:hypothetical protein